MGNERLDQALRLENGNALTSEGAGDAKAVAEHSRGNHLVLGHLGEELVVRGLRI